MWTNTKTCVNKLPLSQMLLNKYESSSNIYHQTDCKLIAWMKLFYKAASVIVGSYLNHHIFGNTDNSETRCNQVSTGQNANQPV